MYIGIDPDTKATGVALVDARGKVIQLETVRAKGVIEMLKILPISISNFIEEQEPNGILAAVVEGQDVNFRFTKRPDDIVRLAQVAGGCAAVLSGLLGIEVAIPKPQKWKGSVPKQIHQARVLRRIGWAFEKRGTKEDGYCVPTDAPFPFGATEWKHLVDAVGLALWMKDQLT